jgi:hypothetical protein
MCFAGVGGNKVVWMPFWELNPAWLGRKLKALTAQEWPIWTASTANPHCLSKPLDTLYTFTEKHAAGHEYTPNTVNRSPIIEGFLTERLAKEQCSLGIWGHSRSGLYIANSGYAYLQEPEHEESEPKTTRPFI